jgi:hypothetical protein
LLLFVRLLCHVCWYGYFVGQRQSLSDKGGGLAALDMVSDCRSNASYFPSNPLQAYNGGSFCSSSGLCGCREKGQVRFSSGNAKRSSSITAHRALF